MALKAALAKAQQRQAALQQEMVDMEDTRHQQVDLPQASGSKRSRSQMSEDNSQSQSLVTDAKGSAFRTKAKGSAFKVKLPAGVIKPRQAEPPVRGKVLKDAREYLRKQESPVPTAQLERALNFSFDQYPEMRDVLLQAEFVDYNRSSGTFSFKYDERVVDKTSLMRFLKANPFGKTLRHVKDLYPAVYKDLQELKTEGRILILAAFEEEQQVIYPLTDAVDAEREKHSINGFDSFLAAEFLATELPKDSEDLARAYKKAYHSNGKAATTVFERVAEIKPERQKQRKQRAFDLNKVTNAHMPELFAGSRATQIDNANY